MIQNCLIRREIAKNLAADGGTAAVTLVFHVAIFNSKNFKKNIRSLNIMYKGFYPKNIPKND